MGPQRRLDGDVLRANVAAFAALGAPVAAVLKQDGYGWGARLLARELDAVVESYVVNDADELAALRTATTKPIRLLSDVPASRLARVLDLGGIPNVSTREAVAAAAAGAERRGPLAVRVGVHDAAGWSAIRAGDAPAFAAAMAGTQLAVEVWTHVSSTARTQDQLDGMLAARAAFAAAGVPVASTDVASTASARRELAFDRLRIGVGLFGARLGAAVDNRCAIRLVAPVVRHYEAGQTGWAGYGDTAAGEHSVAVLRCGYGDGFPKGMAGSADILSVGMQYTARVSHGDDERRVCLIGEADDVDELAARAGIGPHELVVGLAWK